MHPKPTANALLFWVRIALLAVGVGSGRFDDEICAAAYLQIRILHAIPHFWH